MIVQTVMFCVVVGGCLFGLYLSFKGMSRLFQRQTQSGVLYLVVGVPLWRTGSRLDKRQIKSCVGVGVW